MKRIAFTPILLTIFLSGCTLMMDEVPEEEEKVNLEEVGFDEPYTLKSEYGDVTFQYGDSTRVLKAEAMNYLVKVEGDSILYFTDNIPQNLLIPVGMYVSMGCNEHLRHGLCSEVISLTHENGMYCMVTSRRGNDDVFKQMDVDVYVDYDQGMAFNAEEYLEEQGMINERGDTDSIFTDWSLLGQDVVERKEAEIRRRIQARKMLERQEEKPATRFDWPWSDPPEEQQEGDTGDKNYKPKDENSNQNNKTAEKDITIMTVSTNRLKQLFGITKGDKDWKGKLEIAYHEKTTVHHIQKVSNKQDYVKDVYDETPYLRFKVSVGWEKSIWDSGSEKQNLRNFYDKLYKDRKIDKDKINKFRTKDFMIHVPLPVPIPVEFFVRISPSISSSFDFVGEVEFTKGLGKSHKVVEYKDGKILEQTYNSKKEENNTWKFTGIDFCGSFTFDAKVEVLAGFATTGGFFGLGIGADIGFKLTVSKQFPAASTDGLNCGLYLTPKIKAFLSSPAGTEWGSLEFNPFDVITLISFSTKYPFYPKYEPKSGSFTLERNGNKTMASIKASVNMKDLNALKYGGIKNYVVTGNFFRESASGDPEFVGSALPQTLELKVPKVYEFTIVDAEYKDGTYYSFRPLLNNDKIGEVYGNETSDVICKMAGEDSEYPQLNYLNLFQYNYSTKTYPGYRPEDNVYYEIFKFKIRAYMGNIQKQNNWKEWGVEMEVKGYFRESYDDHNIGDYRETFMERKKFPVKQPITKNNIVLSYTVEGPGDTDVEVEATLYYIDKKDKIHYVHMKNPSNEILKLNNKESSWGADYIDKDDQEITLK